MLSKYVPLRRWSLRAHYSELFSGGERERGHQVLAAPPVGLAAATLGKLISLKSNNSLEGIWWCLIYGGNIIKMVGTGPLLHFPPQSPKNDSFECFSVSWNDHEVNQSFITAFNDWYCHLARRTPSSYVSKNTFKVKTWNRLWSTRSSKKILLSSVTHVPSGLKGCALAA